MTLLPVTAHNSNKTEGKWLRTQQLSDFQDLPKPGTIASK
jgi:hypothetical protein